MKEFFIIGKADEEGSHHASQRRRKNFLGDFVSHSMERNSPLCIPSICSSERKVAAKMNLGLIFQKVASLLYGL
jgi:hypothetical protein